MAIRVKNVRAENKVTIYGANVVAMKFTQMKRRAKDVDADAWAEVGTYLSNIAKAQFLTEGARLGDAWQPLAESTLEYKATHGWPLAALIRTTEMSEEFIFNPMNIERYSRKSARFGSRSNKAVWQHYGTEKDGATYIPARPILYVTEEIASEVAEILLDWIVDGT